VLDDEQLVCADMLLCSQLLKYHGPSGDQQKDLLHDIIAYYVELGNPWPPYQHSQIPSHIGSIAIENLLVDLFRQVYLVRSGYTMVCRNQSWQQVQRALGIPKGTTSHPFFLETIYRVILLPYERERRRLETGETRQRQDIQSTHDWIGWSIQVQLVLDDLSGSHGLRLWGTVLAFRPALEEHIILLDIGRCISVHLDDVVVQLGTFDHELANALTSILQPTADNTLAPSNHKEDGNIIAVRDAGCSSNQTTTTTMAIAKEPLCAPSSNLALGPLAWVSNVVFTGMSASSSSQDHLFIEYDLSPLLYHFDTGKKLSELARSWTEPSRKRCAKEPPPVVSKYTMLIIRCVCGCNVDNGDMIRCSQCKIWSHKRCVGWENITDEDTLLHFRCLFCDPGVVPQSKLVQCIVQAIEEGVRKQPKWSDIQERIQEGDFWDHQYEDASSSQSSSEKAKISRDHAPPHPSHFTNSSATTIQGWRSTKRLKNNVREITKGRKRARVQAPPFVRNEEEEKQFYKEFLQFWKTKGKPIQKIPMFRGKPFDFYALYVGVRDRGGEEAVIDNKQWPEIWKLMNNYYKESTDHSFQLRRYYEMYLKEFANHRERETGKKEEEEHKSQVESKEHSASTTLQQQQEETCCSTQDALNPSVEDAQYPKVRIVYSKSDDL